MLGVPVFALGGVLSFLSFLLPFCLLPLLSEGEGAGAGAGAGGGRGGIKTIGHGVGVRAEQGMVGVDGKMVA